MAGEKRVEQTGTGQEGRGRAKAERQGRVGQGRVRQGQDRAVHSAVDKKNSRH